MQPTPEIGSVWKSTVLDENVVIIQTPSKLVLYMFANGSYGSKHVDDFMEHATLVKSREEVLNG